VAEGVDSLESGSSPGNIFKLPSEMSDAT